MEWQAAVAGFVAGAADLLFVSIAAHLELLARHINPRFRASDLDLTLQLGACAGILLARSRSLTRVARASSPQQMRRSLMFLLVSAAPTWIFSVWCAPTTASFLHHPGSLALALSFGAFALFAFVHSPPPSTFFSVHRLGLREALLVGAIHPLALWPGTSHLLVAWLASRLVGFSPRAAFDLSLLLSLAVLGPTCALHLAILARSIPSDRFASIIFTIFGAVVGSFLAVRLARRLLSGHGLGYVALYRVALAVALFIGS